MTDKINTKDAEDIDAIAGQYVLGTLPAEERQYVQTELAHNTQLQSAIADWEDRLLPLNQLTPALTPSNQLWPRISNSLGFEAKTMHASPTGKTASLHTHIQKWIWSNIAFWRSLSITATACTLILTTLLVNQPPSAEYVVVLVAPDGNTPGWVIQAVSHDTVELVPLTARNVPEGQALEFWTKADGWNAPVSLGLVQPGRSLRIKLDQLPPLEANQLFELTLEPATGSPTGLPTGPIQAIGRVVQMPKNI